MFNTNIKTRNNMECSKIGEMDGQWRHYFDYCVDFKNCAVSLEDSQFVI